MAKYDHFYLYLTGSLILTVIFILINKLIEKIIKNVSISACRWLRYILIFLTFVPFSTIYFEIGIQGQHVTPLIFVVSLISTILLGYTAYALKISVRIQDNKHIKLPNNKSRKHNK